MIYVKKACFQIAPWNVSRNTSKKFLQFLLVTQFMGEFWNSLRHLLETFYYSIAIKLVLSSLAQQKPFCIAKLNNDGKMVTLYMNLCIF